MTLPANKRRRRSSVLSELLAGGRRSQAGGSGYGGKSHPSSLNKKPNKAEELGEQKSEATPAKKASEVSQTSLERECIAQLLVSSRPTIRIKKLDSR